jgi:hypothetical protein
MTENISALVGYLDGCSDGVIVGWAYDRTSPGTPPTVDLFCDGRKIATVKASVFRPDLVALPKSQGCAAFRHPVPELLRDAREHEIAARFTSTGEPLNESPQRHVIPVNVAASPRHLLGNIDRIVDGVIHGWALEATAPDLPVLLKVFVDGTELGVIAADAWREDLAKEGYVSGRCAFNYSLPGQFHDGSLHGIAMEGVRCGTRLTGPETFIWNDAAPPDISVPFLENRPEETVAIRLREEADSYIEAGRHFYCALIPADDPWLVGKAHVFDRVIATSQWLGDDTLIDLRPTFRAAMAEGAVYAEGDSFTMHGITCAAEALVHTVSRNLPILPPIRVIANAAPLFPFIEALKACFNVVEDAPVVLRLLHESECHG